MAVKAAKEKQQRKSDAELLQGLSDLVAKSPDLDGVDLRVYVYLFCKLNFLEPVHVPQIEMAMELNKLQTHISRSLRKLIDAGVLLPGPEGTRASKWMLNRDFDK
jgi:predicted transcriptional regulator